MASALLGLLLPRPKQLWDEHIDNATDDSGWTVSCEKCRSLPIEWAVQVLQLQHPPPELFRLEIWAVTLLVLQTLR
jgi:hypothetical protein